MLLHVIVVEHFLEQILDVENVVGDEANELLEPAVLLARDLSVEDVVEEKLGHHGRDHFIDLTPGEVDQHALQPADLTRHIQPHADGILQRAKNRVRSRELMRAPFAVVLVLAASPIALAAPRITFDRHIPAPHDLGAAEEVALVRAIGDNLKVETFLARFVEQVNRSGRLRMRDARQESEKERRAADAFLSVKSFTCDQRTGGAEGNAYDVDGKKV